MQLKVRLQRRLCVVAVAGMLLAACSGSGGGNKAATDAPSAHNRAPVAGYDAVEVLAGTTTRVNVLANDNDPDGDTVWLISATQPVAGQVSIDDGGTAGVASDDRLVYTPATGFTGTEDFAYTISDDDSGRANGSVTVTVVAGDNMPPVANADSVVTGMNVPVAIPVLSNDIDPDGDTVWISAVEAPANGSVTIDDSATPADPGDDRIVYTPEPGYTGPVSFSYRISDGISETVGIVDLIVGGVSGIGISGVVMKGPVQGAHVALYQADSAWQPTGPAIAQTMTDADGAWTTNVASLTSPHLIVANGGSFVNEADGPDASTHTLTNEQSIESLLPAGETQAAVTVYSNALLERARHFADATGPVNAINEARSTFSAVFGFDPLVDLPYSPLATQGPDLVRAYYALALGGSAEALNSIAVDLSQPAFDYEMIRGLVLDLSDCRLNGQSLQGAVIIDIATGMTPLPGDIDLETQVLRFRNNNFARFDGIPLPGIDYSACVSPDIVAPVFTNVPAPATVAAADANGTLLSAASVQAFLSLATATDNDTAGAVVTHDAPALLPMGDTVITFTATDPSGNITTAVSTITVADLTPPTIIAPAGITAVQGGPLTPVVLGSALVSDNVSPAAGIAVSNDAPAGGFPPGTSIVTWTAQDEAGLTSTDTQTITITITSLGFPVLDTPIPDMSATQGVLFSTDLSVYFSDPNMDALSFTAAGLPATLTLAADGTLSGTPANDDLAGSPYLVAVFADDLNSGAVSDSFLLSIVNVNDAPVLVAPIGNQVAIEDAPFSLDLSPRFDDPDGDTLTYSATGLPASMSLSVNGTVSGTATDADMAASPYLVIVTVTDPSTESTGDSFELSISSVNAAPTVSSIADPSAADEDAALGPVAFTVGDEETPPGSLAVTAASSNPGLIPVANILLGGSGGNRTITMTPVADASGSATITVTVSDGTLSIDEAFTVVVNPVNDPPAFSAGGDITVPEDFATTETVTVTPDPVPSDETGQGVTYSLSPASVPWANVAIDAATGEVTVTAMADAAGSQVFTITADDGQSVNNITTDTFTLTINAVNDAPVFSASDDIVVGEDFATTETVVVTPGPVPADETSQSVTYALVPASIAWANVSIDPASGTVSITSVPDGSGTQSFTVVADDGQASDNLATDTFTLTVNGVNDAPSFSVSGDVTVPEDFGTTETVTVTPDLVPADEIGQSVTYSLSPASVPWANVSIDPTTGEVTVTAAADLNGTQLFTITADDGQAVNNTAVDTFTLTVNAVNDAPAFGASGDITVSEDFATTETVTVAPGSVPADETGQSVTYSLSPASVAWANVSINPTTGEVTVTAAADGAGSQAFTITADDGQAVNNTAIDTFTLTVNAVNDAPAFGASGDITVSEDFLTTETVTVTPDPVPADETGQSVTYSLSPASVAWANVSINPTTGEVTITAVADLSGTQLFTITADDGEAANNTAVDTFTLVVNSVNDAPAFITGADIVVSEDFATTETVTVTPGPVPADEAAQNVTYSLSPASVPWANVSINPTTGEVTITAIADLNGTQLFTITADDGQAVNNTAIDTFTLTVNAVNDRPSFSTSGNIVVSEDFATTETVTVTPDPVPADETGQSVTYSLSPASVPWANVSLNPTTGEVTVTAVADGIGSQVFVITANDGQAVNNTATGNFTLIVNAVNDAPTFNLSGDINVLPDFATTETVTVTPDPVPADETGQSVTYSLSPASVPWANVSINLTTGEVTITSVPAATGAQLFTITADDGQAANNTATDTFTLTVGNVAPVITGQVAPVTIDEDDPVAITLADLTVTDPDNVYPADFTLTVQAGANYTFVGNTVTPVNHFNGALSVNVIVNDGMDDSAPFAYAITVNPINDAPAFVADDFILAEDFTGSQTSTVTPDPVPADETGQTVSYSILPDPAAIAWANVTFNGSTGQISATAVANQSGSQVFTVTADDGQAANNTAMDTFTFTVNAVNDPPVFTASGDINVDEDFVSTETVTVTPGSIPADETAQVVSYSLSPASVSWVNISINSSTGEVTITAIPNRGGTQVFTIIADDGEPANNIATDTFTLSMNPINDPPTFGTSGSLILDEDFPGTETVTVIPAPTYFDDALQTVTYTLTPPAASISYANVSFNPATGQISATSIPNLFGSQVVTITADDGQPVDNTAAQSILITVNSVNDAPTFSITPDVVVDADFSSTEQVLVTPDPVPADETGQLAGYSLSPASVGFANVSIDSGTGDVTITSVPAATGCQVFTITADDGQPVNNIATGQFSLMVRGGAANEDLNGDGVPDGIQLDVGARACFPASNVVNVDGFTKNNVVLPAVPAGPSSTDPTFVLYEPNPGTAPSNASDLDLSLLPGACRNIVFYGSLDAGGNLVLDAGAPTTNFEVNNGRAAFIDGCQDISVYNIGLSGGNNRGVEAKDNTRLYMENVRIWDNQGGDGGGIYVDNGDLEIVNSVIADNYSTGKGGGLMVKGSGSNVIVENTIFSGNRADDNGGAVYLEDSGSGVRLFNTLITANATPSSGGGVYFKSPNGAMLVDSTVAFNEAPDGAGVYREGGSLTLQDNIVYFNRTSGGAISTYNGSISGAHSSYNLIEQAPVGLNDIDITGVGPGWLGGYYLNQGSPGIDSGSTTSALLGLNSWYTDASGGTPDVGTVDRGYHFPTPSVGPAATYRETDGVNNQITVWDGWNDVPLIIEPLIGGQKIGRGRQVFATLEGPNAAFARLDNHSDVDPLGDGRSIVLTDLGNGVYEANIDSVGSIGAPTTITLRLVIDGAVMPVVFSIDRAP